MIRYALACLECDCAFDAWFSSSAAFDEQSKGGLVSCPACDGASVAKQIMAPSISGTKRTGGSRTVQAEGGNEARAFVEAARKHVAETFDYVGDGFADEARAIHYGETDARPIYGETTAEESKALKEEGVEALPLPPALAPKKPRNKRKLN